MSAFNTWDVRIYKITTQCLILARSFVIWSNKIQIYEKIFPDRRPGNLYHHFQLGYVFHDIIMAGFFKAQIGPIQRETYIIPLIALAFVLYIIFQAYLLPIYFEYTSRKYHWG